MINTLGLKTEVAKLVRPLLFYHSPVEKHKKTRSVDWLFDVFHVGSRAEAVSLVGRSVIHEKNDGLIHAGRFSVLTY